MGDSRTRVLTKHLRRYDDKLYAKREQTGAIHVYRDGVGFYPFEWNGLNFKASFPSPDFVLALTDNWTVRGRPIEWGIEPLLHRIQKIDGWRNDHMADKLIEGYERRDMQKKKDLHNQNEAFFGDHHRQFKKAFSEINTSNMDLKKGF